MPNVYRNNNKKLDVRTATDKELANSQIDYFIDKGLMNSPVDVDVNRMNFFTDEFESLSSKEQDKLINKVGSEWWDEVAKDYMNNIYTDKLIDKTEEGDILDWWNIQLKNNSISFDEMFGIKNYLKQISNNNAVLKEQLNGYII